MDGGVVFGREKESRLHGCGSEMRERGGGGAEWMGEMDKAERSGRGWMDGGVG